jgi:hypothetical protein
MAIKINKFGKKKNTKMSNDDDRRKYSSKPDDEPESGNVSDTGSESSDNSISSVLSRKSEDLDRLDFARLLADLFPSKYTKDKLKQVKKEHKKEQEKKEEQEKKDEKKKDKSFKKAVQDMVESAVQNIVVSNESSSPNERKRSRGGNTASCSTGKECSKKQEHKKKTTTRGSYREDDDASNVSSSDDERGVIQLKNGHSMTKKAMKELKNGVFNIVIALDSGDKPSRHSSKRRRKSTRADDDDEEEEEQIYSASEENEDDNSSYDSDYDSEDDEEDSDYDSEEDSDYDSEDDEEDSDYDSDDDEEDSDYDSGEDEEDSSSDTSDSSDTYEVNSDEDDDSPIIRKRLRNGKVVPSKKKSDIELLAELDKEQEQIDSTKKTLLDLLAANPKNKVAKKTLNTILEQREKLTERRHKIMKKSKTDNIKCFKKLLRKKNSTNDLRYFKKNLSIQEQRKVIDEMEAVHKISLIDKPYRLTLLETDIPLKYKAVALKKISALRCMEPGCGEYYKVKNWVDTFMRIPFNKYRSLPLTIEDGIEKCSQFMMESKKTLDDAVYGLNDAKLQIMQMVGQWLTNPTAMGTAIAIKGPMGTGKTSCVKDGISKILGRDFAFIPLGGATDSSFLEGHSYTYEGSTWGKIVDILLHCNSMNPVIYFDELDKISETAKGEEIVGILTHLTDTSQNAHFHDKYFAEIDFDLSKCLFIFSYNDESKVNPILLDRMYKIQTTGYNKKDKTKIAHNYLIPKIRKEVGFKEGEIMIPDEVIEYIVENMTDKEEGVRNLKRCLEIIHTKLNLYRLIKTDTMLFEKEMSLKVSFPYTLTTEIVDKLIKKTEQNRPMSLYL